MTFLQCKAAYKVSSPTSVPHQLSDIIIIAALRANLNDAHGVGIEAIGKGLSVMALEECSKPMQLYECSDEFRVVKQWWCLSVLCVWNDMPFTQSVRGLRCDVLPIYRKRIMHFLECARCQ